MLTALIVAFLFAEACLYFDAHWSDKGIKAGIAREGSWLVKLVSRTKTPKFWQVYVIETALLRAPTFIVGLIAGGPGSLLFTILLCVFALMSIKGGRQWMWMFAHPGQPLPVMNTVWQKFIGFWG